MAGSHRRLDFWASADTFKWLDAREMEIWDRYMELGRIHTVIAELRERLHAEGSGGLAPMTFYAWLGQSEEREDRWKECRTFRAFLSADKGMETALNTTQATANADRLKYEAHMRAAEWQNRDVFGKRPAAVTVAVGAGDWLEALRSLPAQTPKRVDEITEAEYKFLPKVED